MYLINMHLLCVNGTVWPNGHESELPEAVIQCCWSCLNHLYLINMIGPNKHTQTQNSNSNNSEIERLTKMDIKKWSINNN